MSTGVKVSHTVVLKPAKAYTVEFNGKALPGVFIETESMEGLARLQGERVGQVLVVDLGDNGAAAVLREIIPSGLRCPLVKVMPELWAEMTKGGVV